MDHLLDDEELPRHERELTLSTGSILGIFLALVVLCGGFFGFGYNMGRKSAPTPLNLSEVATEPTSPGLTSTGKPPAGSPASDSTPVVVPAPPVVKRERRTPPPPAASSEDSSASLEAPKPVTRPATPVTPAPIVRQPAVIAPTALNPGASAATATGSYMVQVAAVSHKEDADLLLGALHARGYSVSARTNANDNFIHVQVGPFRDKASADAMRQRLIADGYNAIVK